MQSADAETIRRALASALESLGANKAEIATVGGTGKNDPQLVLVVIKESASPSEGDTRVVRDKAGHEEHSHPGLDRFTIEESDSKLPAPKKCFMEPDRACVHSGACEMRGF
jgi:hypothetical protein